MQAEKYLLLQDEIKPYLAMLRKASRAIIDEGVSEHPVFVFHQQTVELGIELAKRHQVNGNWSVNASSLEELVMKQVIHNDRVENFKDNYKDPSEYFCLLVLSEMGAEFVFVPQTLD